MEILEALKNIGLSEKEARVYIALLQTGRTSAYVVALRSDLKKPTVYVILDELVEKGLVSKVPRAKKKVYEAKSPEEVFALAEERLSLAKTVLPELKSITKKQVGKVQTLYFEGMSGMKQALQYRIKEMKNKEFVGFYAIPEGTDEKLMPVINEYLVNMKKNKTTIRGISPEHPSLKEYREKDEEYGRETKVVAYKDYSSDISIDIGDTFVRVISNPDLQATIIENPKVAKTMKQVFEMVWEKCDQSSVG